MYFFLSFFFYLAAIPLILSNSSLTCLPFSLWLFIFSMFLYFSFLPFHCSFVSQFPFSGSLYNTFFQQFTVFFLCVLEFSNNNFLFQEFILDFFSFFSVFFLSPDFFLQPSIFVSGYLYLVSVFSILFFYFLFSFCNYSFSPSRLCFSYIFCNS